MIDSAVLGSGRRRLLGYGDHALLLECDDGAGSRSMHQWLLSQHRPEIVELVPGARTVLLRLAAPLPADFIATMIDIDVPSVATADVHAVQLDVRYDGDDLAEVARLLERSEEALIEHHTGQEWVVAFCGFAPGFGYLTPTRHELRVPRRASPRTRVPAGSVALADTWSAVYPTASPGGWQLIGSTDVRLFDPAADPPALLTPGTRVRFRRTDS